MARPLSPQEKILKATKAALLAWDWQAAIELTPNIRHWRYRHSNPAERPCISIRYIDVNPNVDMGRYHNTDEECWIMAIELIVDMALPREESDDDETGVGLFTTACNQAFKALSDVSTGLVNGAQICDDVLDMGDGPDDDSSPDEGRLVQSVNVLYRTPTGDRSILLAPGENL